RRRAHTAARADSGDRRKGVMNQIIRVVVVDDSAYVRKVMKEMLSRSPFIEVVGTARDGEDALDVVERLRPDVVTCDLIMPGSDGVDFIRRQMTERAVPIVVVSIAAESSERVLSALDAGAVDFVQKPTALATERILDMADEVIPRLPATFPIPIAIVLHMPVGYTAAYAKRLDEMSALTVVEAAERDEVRPGTVLIAPAGRHLTFRRDAAGVMRVRLDLSPLDTPHKPSVDVLFQSAADIYGDRVLGVVMTGMGDDGRAGAAWIKARNGSVLTESEDTCIVYGMPRAVVEAGLSDASVALERLADAIVERV